MSKRLREWLVPVGLLAAIAAIMVGSFLLADTSKAAEGEAFGGTDAQVTAMLEEKGVEPWAKPPLKLGSGEVESGLFALQAALGAGVLGYVFGNLRGRKAARDTAAASEPTT